MVVLSTLAELELESRRAGLSRGLGGVLVPTMGALHRGHEALIRRGAQLARERGWASGCTATIFVNPTQFNDAGDFNRYPRTLDADLAICRAAGASAVFAPGPESIYPADQSVPVPPLPPVATSPGLEDARRPGHFAGVCQVVLRLFDLLRPEAAIFGEKDWQQLRVIAAMTAQQGLPIEIVPHPTLREPDGLALSSRNRFLSPEERRRAAAIPEALCRASSTKDAGRAEAIMRQMIVDAGLELEYAVIRDAAGLGPSRPGQPGRALVAARAGATRLIDNAPWVQ